MIFAVFLCTSILSRPELDACDQIGLGPFRSEADCQTELLRNRKIGIDNGDPIEFEHGFVYHMPARQWLVCKHLGGWQD